MYIYISKILKIKPVLKILTIKNKYLNFRIIRYYSPCLDSHEKRTT